MYCADPNSNLDGENLNEPVEEAGSVVESLQERVQDFEKENAVLRASISEAWDIYNRSQEALTEAKGQVEELSAQNKMLSQYLMDTSVGFECLSTCGSDGHEPECPVSNPVAAWRLTRDQLEQVTLQLQQSREETKQLQVLVEAFLPGEARN